LQADVKIANEVEDFAASLRVEIAGRLVGQQDRRVDGEFVGQMLDPRTKLDQVEQLRRPLLVLPAGPSAQV
jgi:hypothetical protein